MPARNEAFHGPIWREGTAGGWRYYWRILGAHADALSGETITQIRGTFFGAPTGRFSFNKQPFGLGSYDTASMDLRLSSVKGTNLFTYLTDPGILVDYGIYINTVWILMCDMGDATKTAAEFDPLNCYVQLHTDEDEITREDPHSLTMSVELTHIGAAVLTALSPKVWGTRLMECMPRLGGTRSPALDCTIRRRFYEYIARDSDNQIYAVGNRFYRPKEDAHPELEVEYLFLRYLDCYSKLEELCTELVRKILRSASRSFIFRTTKSDGYSIGTPFDFKINFAQGLDIEGTKGHELSRFDRQWLAFIKEHPDEPAGALAGLFFPGDSDGRQPDGWCTAYESVLDLITDQTREGFSKAIFLISGTGYDCDVTLQFFRVRDSAVFVAAGSMPPASAYVGSTKPKIRRAGNIVGGCEANAMLQVGNNEGTVKYRLPSTSETLQAVPIKCTVTTTPCLGGQHRYFAGIPTPKIKDKDLYPEAGRQDFGGDVYDTLIVMRSLFTVNRWFYIQDSDSTGTGTGPDWIDATESLVVLCDHRCEYDSGGMPGVIPYEGTIQMPTLRDKWGDEFRGREVSDYDEWYTERLEAALRARQQNSDMFCIAFTVACAFGNRNQTVTTIEIARPNVYGSVHRAARFAFDPLLIFPDVALNAAVEASIISIDSGYKDGRDKIELWNRGAS